MTRHFILWYTLLENICQRRRPPFPLLRAVNVREIVWNCIYLNTCILFSVVSQLFSYMRSRPLQRVSLMHRRSFSYPRSLDNIQSIRTSTCSLNNSRRVFFSCKGNENTKSALWSFCKTRWSVEVTHNSDAILCCLICLLSDTFLVTFFVRLLMDTLIDFCSL